MKKPKFWTGCNTPSSLCLKMKLTTMLVVLSLLKIQANTYSQTTKITIEMESVTVMDVLEKIESLSEFKFLGNTNVIDQERLVSVRAKNKRIFKVLNQLFKGTDVVYKVLGQQIILVKDTKPKPVIKVAPVHSNIQFQVNGTVADENGSPLPGANILEKGTENGVQSDFDGNFSISVVDENAILEVSYIGFVTQEFPLNGQSNITITLVEDIAGLEEVIVVGYGAQKKANLTGAVSQVAGEKLQRRPIVNAGQGLQGLIPNLNINFSDGAAGQGATFNVRGFTAINGGGPLILVDGVVMDPNLINPTEIESVSVLRDAASAAIYGSRGAFGVVLITTKRGQKGQKPRIQFSSNYSVNSPTIFPKMVNSVQQLELQDEKQRNLGNPITDNIIRDGIRAYFNDPDNNPSAIINPNDPNSYLYFGNTDWFDEVIGTGALFQNNLSMSGSGDAVSYFVSAGWLDQSGILNYGNDSFDRYNLRTRIDIDATDWLQFNINALYTNTQRDNLYNYEGIGTLWHDLTRKPVNLPITNPDGTATDSPIPLMSEGGRDITNGSDNLITLGTTIKPFDGLQLSGAYTYNGFFQERKRHKKRVDRYNGPVDAPNSLNTIHTTPTELFLDTAKSDYYAINIYGEYEKTFADDHYFKATLGFNEERKKYRFLSSSNTNLITDDIPSLDLTTGAPQAGEVSTIWAIQGYFYRLNYIYKDKYLLEFNGRYDASSRFPEDDRWGFFPSVSMGWRISNENFFAALKPVVSNLKLRWSYGQLGNQAVDDDRINALNFPYLPTLGSFRPRAILGGVRPVFLATPSLVSSSLTWETATSINYGLDASLFDNRLNLTFDYFEREVVDQLSEAAALPATLGTTAPRANAVESVTRGWEVEVNWRDRIGEVSYNIGFNLADAQGEITKFDNPTKSLGSNLDEFYEGREIGEIWGYETNGLFDSAAEYQSSGLDYSNRTSLPIAGGDVWYVDQDGNGIIDNGLSTVDDPGDLRVIGNTTPRYTFGITMGAEWKGVYVDILMQGVGKRDLALSGGLFWPNEGGVPQISHLDYWTEDNSGAYWPRYLGNQGGFNYAVSDRYLQDFSYLRMRQLTLGFRLPQSVLDKIFLNSANIYLTGQNLFEFANIIDGFDPETNPDGFNDWGPGKSYPFSRSVSLGIDITL